MKEVQRFQTKLKDAQESLRDETVIGSSGGGLVKVTMNGAREILRVEISKEAVDPNDLETLEDLVFIAFRQAQEEASRLYESKMGEITGEFGGMLPPGLF